MEIIIVLIIAAFLGLIPAYMAKNKGYSFGVWWAYGWLLFIVAIIHVQFIPDLTDPKVKEERESIKTVEDVNRQKKLLEKGEITQQEYERKKNQLLGL